MTSQLKRLFCGICAVLLSGTMLSACGNETETAEKKETTRTILPATPAIGVGRIMPIKYEPKTFTVLIDPGHGFEDGGTGEGVLPDGILEKDINLAIAKYLNEALTTYGFRIVMSHDGVTFPQSVNTDNNNKFRPEERVRFANSLDIDYYISIHVNSHTDSSASGARVYYQQTWIKENKNSELMLFKNADHTFNILSGDTDVFEDVCNATVDWFYDTLYGI